MKDVIIGVLIGLAVVAAIATPIFFCFEMRARYEKATVPLKQQVEFAQMETDITIAGIEAEKEKDLAKIRYNGIAFVVRTVGDYLFGLAAVIDNLLSPEDQQLQRLQRREGK